jgi:leucyl aminopeptidase
VTTFALRNASPAKTRADAVVVGIVKSANGPLVVSGAEDIAAAWGRKFRPLLSSLGITGKAGEVVKFPSGGAVRSPLLVLVGLGEDPDSDSRRRAAGVAARAVTNSASVALALGGDGAQDVRAVTEGWLLGGYTFTEFKRDTKGGSTEASEVVVLSASARKAEVVEAFEAAQVVAAAVAKTRDWVNRPPGDLTPPKFAEAVTSAHALLAKTLPKGKDATQVGITVYDEQQLAELGCGGILGVGMGSDAPPRLVELTYAPTDATVHLALVGKGITFDSGGLTIKPAQAMDKMKCDMAGAATVIQATFAIAQLGLPVKVSTFAPMAENMVSGSSVRPGDVLTAANGTTVEVLNTDAEGRLVLMDALVRAAATEPDVIVDVATLTGHMVVALGEKIAGVMGSDDIVEAVVAAGAESGEIMWPMPIPEEMSERITSSKVADLSQHDWVRWGGGLFAGAFLREFTDGRPWAHIDIAGPAYNSGAPTGHLTSGGTGFAVSTLVDYARTLAESS